jgi:hypothetical protein
MQSVDGLVCLRLKCLCVCIFGCVCGYGEMEVHGVLSLRLLMKWVVIFIVVFAGGCRGGDENFVFLSMVNLTNQNEWVFTAFLFVRNSIGGLRVILCKRRVGPNVLQF